MEMVGDPPPKLVKALAVIADKLHPTFARQPWIEHAAKSKESCVLSSLAVRDFLVGIGFIAAQVRPVATVMRAMRGDEQLHSLGVGIPGALDHTPRHWNGHMVVQVEGYLIDSTLYRMARPQWPGLAGMMTLPLEAPSDPSYRAYGLRPISGLGLVYEPDTFFELMYLDNGANTSWQRGGDACERWRREAAVAAMVERFGQWEKAR
jgi:hypothetical protein